MTFLSPNHCVVHFESQSLRTGARIADRVDMSVRIVVAVIALASAGLDGMHVQLPGPVRTEDPVPAGTGATLIVVAPGTLCAPDLELIVSRTTTGRQYVFQTPVTPPECRWTIADVLPGDYQAVLQKARGGQRMVGMSRLDVHPGSTWTMTIAPMNAAVEGLITVQRIAVAGAYVEVKQNGDPGLSWEGRTDNDGYYRIAVQADTDLCIRVMLPNALNSMSPQCLGFGPGLNHRDFDLPPGRIDVVLLPRDGPIHPTPILLAESSAGSASVTVTGRAERSFVALPYGKHHVRATTMEFDRDFDAVDVVLTPDEPVKRISLSVPYSR